MFYTLVVGQPPFDVSFFKKNNFLVVRRLRKGSFRAKNIGRASDYV